jgi:succinate dehydrogenase / fumarate reductase membrane anchor subunit
MMRTPLSRVRHFGSAHGGTDTFWLERITAAASLILTIFFIGLMVGLAGRPYADVVAVLGSPWIAALGIMFIVAVAMHMRVGMEAIIVDYVPKDGQKIAWLIANTFFSIAVAAIAILAILKIALGN